VKLPHLSPHPSGHPPAPGGLEILAVHADGTVEDWEMDPVDDDDNWDSGPVEFEDDLESESSAEDGSGIVNELELMDASLESGLGIEVASLLGQGAPLPSADSLSDEEIEPRLKAVLAELAIFGVGLSVCEHFSPRQCYELLLAEILPECHAYRELQGTGWVQRFITHEFCPICDKEAEADFQAYESKRKKLETDDDGDVPF
jgi:hypothetical protein